MSENCGPGATYWSAEQSALLRGIAHALSNRIGTISAVAGMLTPGTPVAAPMVDALQDEAGRLEALLGLLRLLAGDGDAEAPEPLHVPDIVRQAVELHAHHPSMRDIACVIDDATLGVPARALHGGLTRALLLTLSAAKHGESGGVRISWAEAPTAVILTVDGDNGGVADVASAATLQLSGAGTVQATASGYRFELPRLG